MPGANESGATAASVMPAGRSGNASTAARLCSETNKSEMAHATVKGHHIDRRNTRLLPKSDGLQAMLPALRVQRKRH